MAFLSLRQNTHSSHRGFRWFAPALVLVALLAAPAAIALITGPPSGHTGAPKIGLVAAEPTCARSGCHLGNPTDFQGELEVIGVPEDYTPGVVYPITVRLTSTATAVDAQRRWGFEITAVRLSDGLGGGTWNPGAYRLEAGLNERDYVTHLVDFTFPGTASPAEWSFSWTAPATDEGPIAFYAAGNAANGNVQPTGDFIYTVADTTAGTVPVERATWGAIKAMGLN